MPPAQPRSAPTASIERFFQFSLLGLVASGYFALVGSGFLDRPTLILTLLGLILRAATVAGLVRLDISARAVTLAATAYIGFFAIDFYYLSHDFLAATVHGVCFLAVVKILTARSNRDYIYTGVISFIELVAAALLSARSSFFFLLTLYLLFAIAAFTSAEIRRGMERAAAGESQTGPPPRTSLASRLALVAAASTLGILFLTAGLFLLIPRTALMAATLFPNTPRLTGFSSVVDLGGFGKISRDDRPVMHVLSSARPLPPGLKWRGAALSRFDGRRWFQPLERGTEIPAAPNAAVVADRLQLSRRDGHRMLYRVNLQNADTGALFIAGIPEFINIDAPRLLVSPEATFRVPGPVRSLRYQVSALNAPLIPRPLPAGERARYLQFPPLDARIIALARQWGSAPSDLDRAVNIQRHLRSDFRYKLDGPEHPVADPLADFLFVRKEGYCEYFASAMAVMLRSLGTPTRVATGFQSGYFNDVSGLYVIRASDAHAWVEAWIEGHGWMTFDPTPVSAAALQPSLFSKLDMYLDAADNTWHEWVVSYDLNHQVALAARFEATLRRISRPTGRRDWSTRFLAAAKNRAPAALAMLAFAAFAIFFAPRLWRNFRRKSLLRRIARSGGSAHDASILYERLLEHLASRGFHKPPAATPAEFARDLPASETRKAAQFTELYNVIRFGGDVSATARLATLLKEYNCQ